MNPHEPSDSWELVFRGYDPEAERLRETLCALGNGVLVTRGAAEESTADGTHYPGTYLAGGYNRLVSQVSDQEISNEDLVNFPNWLPLTFRIGEEPWFDLSAVEIIEFHYISSGKYHKSSSRFGWLNSNKIFRPAS